MWPILSLKNHNDVNYLGERTLNGVLIVPKVVSIAWGKHPPRACVVFNPLINGFIHNTDPLWLIMVHHVAALLLLHMLLLDIILRNWNFCVGHVISDLLKFPTRYDLIEAGGDAFLGYNGVLWKQFPWHSGQRRTPWWYNNQSRVSNHRGPKGTWDICWTQEWQYPWYTSWSASRTRCQIVTCDRLWLSIPSWSAHSQQRSSHYVAKGQYLEIWSRVSRGQAGRSRSSKYSIEHYYYHS